MLDGKIVSMCQYNGYIIIATEYKIYRVTEIDGTPRVSIILEAH
jgi:hypothetical protein